MDPLIVATIIIVFGVAVVVTVAAIARINFVNFVKSEKEIINNIVTLVNRRNSAINTALQEHIAWLVEDFNANCIEIFMSDSYLLAMKEKYNIGDTEFVMAFQNVIGDVQNINRVKTQELLTKVSNSMIDTVKEQLGDK